MYYSMCRRHYFWYYYNFAPNQGPTTTINLGAWTQSVDDTHSRLVDVDWNATYPIYDLVSDPAKK